MQRLSEKWAWLVPAFVICFWFIVAMFFRGGLFPNYDLLNDFENAVGFVESGSIPQKGSVSSFGSFNPPGVTLGMLSGVLLFADCPTAAQRLGATFWFSVAVLGLFVYVRRRFGLAAACLAVLLYGFSETGVFFAQTLWPRAHPAFLIWLLYFVDRWCLERDAKSLFPVILILGLATYWMLEFAPVLFALPLLFLIFRPPIQTRFVLLGSISAILVWSPYLVFQGSRDFVDLRSLLTQSDVEGELRVRPTEILGIDHLEMVTERLPNWNAYFRGDSEATGETSERVLGLNDESLGNVWVRTPSARGLRVQDERFGAVWILHRKSRRDGFPGHAFFSPVYDKWFFQADETFLIFQQERGWEKVPHEVRIYDGAALRDRPRFVSRDGIGTTLLSNFRNALFPGLGGVVFSIVYLWCLLLALTYDGKAIGTFSYRRWHGLTALSPPALFAVYLLLSGSPKAIETGVSLYLILGTYLTSAGGAFSRKLRDFLPPDFPDRAFREPFLILAIVLLIPWLLIAVLVGTDNWIDAERRYMWLGILQIALFACVADRLARTFQLRTWTCLIMSGLFLLAFAGNERLLAEMRRLLKAEDWQSAYERLEAIGWLAEHLEESGVREASIGYDKPFLQFHLHWHPIDVRYKVGREFDAVLYHTHGIRNLNTLAEGVSEVDDYMIVRKTSPSGGSIRYWDLSNFRRMTVLKEGEFWAVLVPEEETGGKDADAAGTAER